MWLMLVFIIVLICFIAAIFVFSYLFNKQENDEITIKEYNMEGNISKLNYRKGDVIQAVSGEFSELSTKILIHICNNRGGWGAGFVLSLSKKWKEPENEYRSSFTKKSNHNLGDIQIVKISNDIYVINMIAQNGYKTIDNPTPLHYESLEKCLQKVMVWIDKNHFYFPEIYCPKIGTGLAGGDWNIIENILNDNLNEVPVNVYEL